uniref:Uncharacterized protein n=1 Tax=Manihot esculenta TaxID=3983 RepID=A0A2C9UAF8_MANES
MKKPLLVLKNLNNTVKEAAEANTVLENLVDMHNGVVGLLRSTIRHIVYMQYHIRHLYQQSPNSNPNPNPKTSNLVSSSSPRSL